MNNERRREERLTWGAKVKVQEVATGRVISADSRLRNIAKHGFSLVTEDHLTRGAQYRFFVLLPTSQLEVVARIVHFHIEATYYVCGAKIEKLSLIQKSRINHFLASKSGAVQRRFLVYSIVTAVVVALAAKLVVGLGISASAGIFFATFVVCFLLLPF